MTRRELEAELAALSRPEKADVVQRLAQQIGDAWPGIDKSVVDVLAFATASARVLLTLNRWHFVALHAARPGHAGIVVCSQDPDVDGQARRIQDAVLGHQSLAGVLIRVNRPA